MFKGIEEQKLDYYKLGASLFGVDLEKESKKREEENRMLFKDPSEYNNMSEEEKQTLTDKMMGHYKKWANKEGLTDA